MFTVAQLLCALLLPVGLAAVLTVMFSALRSRTVGGRAPALDGAVLVLAVAVAHAATATAVDARLFPPLLGWHWLPWATVALIPILLWATPSTARDGRWLIHATAAAAGAVLILVPLCHGLSVTGIAGWAAAITASSLLTGWTTRQAPAGPVVEHLAAGIATVAVAIGALLCGSKDLALLAGIVPCALVGSGLVHLVRREPWLGGGLAIAPLIAWHLALNATYSEMPWWTALLLALPLPLGALAARLGRTPRTASAWRLGLTAAAALVAIILAATLAQPAPTAATPDAPTDHY